ncbi:hypothetical protein CES86_3694 [Brucella lupini]|uniref:Uncharacterized protein n=1 Tax=Brucella lupini TaxID=255457 RepID=A0A256GHZ5_9HYPH|nr:hypothetical protein CES86_3694 [Brucella lupini]
MAIRFAAESETVMPVICLVPFAIANIEPGDFSRFPIAAYLPS